MNVALTPARFHRAGAAPVRAAGGCGRRRASSHLRRVRRPLPPAGRRSSHASASSPAIGSRTCAATRSSCSRRTTAWCSPAPSSRRSTSGSRTHELSIRRWTTVMPSSSWCTRRSPATDLKVAQATRHRCELRGRSSPRRLRFAREPVDEDAVCELFYTSGSTGQPRGAMLTHRALATHADRQRPHDGPAPSRRRAPHHPALPRQRLGHAALRHRARRGATCCSSDSTPARCSRLIEAERVTRLFARARRWARALLTHPDLGRRDLSSLVQVTRRRRAARPTAARRAGGGVRVRGHLRLRAHRGQPAAHQGADAAVARRAAGRRATPPPGDDRAAEHRRRTARLRRRRRRGAVGRRRRRARSAPARTT